jgi:hypothetical protein
MEVWLVWWSDTLEGVYDNEAEARKHAHSLSSDSVFVNEETVQSKYVEWED